MSVGPNVVKTMQGISRLHGAPRKQAAAIRLKDLDKMVQYLEECTSTIHIRNRALILLGYFGAFRRSEIVSLSWDQVSFVSDGIVIKRVHAVTVCKLNYALLPEGHPFCNGNNTNDTKLKNKS